MLQASGPHRSHSYKLPGWRDGNGMEGNGMEAIMEEVPSA